MFQCEVTGKLSKRGEKLNKLVVLTRERVYTSREKNVDTGQWEDVYLGKGWEVVRELKATDEGVAEWNSMTPAQRTLHLQHV